MANQEIRDRVALVTVLAVNLTAAFLLCRACLPSMYGRGFGRIVNVASVAGRMGLNGQTLQVDGGELTA